MNDGSGSKKLQVLAVIEREDKPTIWRQVGVAFQNGDGKVYPPLSVRLVATAKRRT